MVSISQDIRIRNRLSGLDIDTLSMSILKKSNVKYTADWRNILGFESERPKVAYPRYTRWKIFLDHPFKNRKNSCSAAKPGPRVKTSKEQTAIESITALPLHRAFLSSYSEYHSLID
jgi:hypothetical protein